MRGYKFGVSVEEVDDLLAALGGELKKRNTGEITDYVDALHGGLPVLVNLGKLINKSGGVSFLQPVEIAEDRIHAFLGDALSRGLT